MQLGSLPIIKSKDIVDANPIGQVTEADLTWKNDIEDRVKKLEQMKNILMFALALMALLYFAKK